MKNNKLFTAISLNHEMMSPGPQLSIAVQCNLKSDDLKMKSQKVFNITIIDQNDNLIKVQDKMINLTLNSPYFKQVGGIFIETVVGELMTFNLINDIHDLPQGKPWKRMCL